MESTNPKTTTSKVYFGPREEQAILYFLDPQTPADVKEVLFSRALYKPLRKLATAVIRRYATFIGRAGSEELEDLGFTNLYEALHKLTPHRLNTKGKPCRAYSYYGTIVHNFCKTYGLKTYKTEILDIPLDQVTAELELDSRYSEGPDSQELGPDYSKLLGALTSTIRTRLGDGNIPIKPAEQRVGQALLSIFENWRSVTMGIEGEEEKLTPWYLKKKVFHLLRELTGMPLKEVKLNLKAFQGVYRALASQAAEEANDMDIERNESIFDEEESWY